MNSKPLLISCLTACVLIAVMNPATALPADYSKPRSQLNDLQRRCDFIEPDRLHRSLTPFLTNDGRTVQLGSDGRTVQLGNDDRTVQLGNDGRTVQLGNDQLRHGSNCNQAARWFQSQRVGFLTNDGRSVQSGNDGRIIQSQVDDLPTSK